MCTASCADVEFKSGKFCCDREIDGPRNYHLVYIRFISVQCNLKTFYFSKLTFCQWGACELVL